MENELYRASHVMVWAGFMDFLEEKLGSDGFAKRAQSVPGVAEMAQLTARLWTTFAYFHLLSICFHVKRPAQVVSCP